MGYPLGVDPFIALADPVRRSLLAATAGSPARVVDLARGRAISRPAISKHLRVLLEAGLVAVQERGRERWYSVRPEGLAEVDAFTDRLRGPSVRFGTAALDGLDLEVRRAGRERRRGEERTDPTVTEETA